jgi:hypothetical protein
MSSPSKIIIIAVIGAALGACATPHARTEREREAARDSGSSDSDRLATVYYESYQKLRKGETEKDPETRRRWIQEGLKGFESIREADPTWNPKMVENRIERTRDLLSRSS